MLDVTPESSLAVETQAEPASPAEPEPGSIGIFGDEKTAPAENAGESATPESPEPEGEKPEGESVSAPEAAKRPESKAEARIRQLTAKVRDMERRLQEAGQPRPQQAPNLAQPAKPKLEQFETVEAFDSA